MSREIKFRGLFYRDHTQWIYGLLGINFKGKRTICNANMQYPLAVDPETIGQFIGIKDEKEKEIYEGDIVYANWHGGYDGCGYFYDKPFVVEWDDDFSCFGFRHKDESFSLEKFLGEYDGVYFKLSGNIYENPELLEAVNDG